MANTFKFTRRILQIAAIELYNALKFGDLVTTYSAKEYKAPSQGASGPTVDVPMPIRYLAQDGPNFAAQAITETTKPVTLDQHKFVGLDMAVFDMTLNTEGMITKATEKYIRPAILTLADSVDDYIAGLGVKLHQTAGAAGTTPGSGTAAQTQQILADAEMIMTENGVPESVKRSIILNPKAAGYLPTALSSLFVREAQEAVTKGKIGHAIGFDLYKSNNIRKHTSGTLAAGALVNGADQTGSTVNINTLDGGDSVVVGDVVTFAGCYAVNPVNKRQVSSDRLMQFRITAAAAEGGAAMALTIDPPIITSGAYQNCSGSPTTGGSVTRKASHVANMAICKETLVLATMPFKKPLSAVIAELETYNGISMLLTAAYDINTFKESARLDILFGGRELYPETGVRMLG